MDCVLLKFRDLIGLKIVHQERGFKVCIRGLRGEDVCRSIMFNKFIMELNLVYLVIYQQIMPYNQLFKV